MGHVRTSKMNFTNNRLKFTDFQDESINFEMLAGRWSGCSGWSGGQGELSEWVERGKWGEWGKTSGIGETGK